MTEIEKMLTFNYEECCDYLKVKYGVIKKNYFTSPLCKYPNNSIKRGKEGLFIHHIDEDKAIMLSESEYAIKNPFEYQHGNRLVYCNLLEHLVLHIKIVENPHPDKNKDEDVGVGGIFNYIIPELNDIYSGIEYSNWKIAVIDSVIDFKKDYFKCLEYLMKISDIDLKYYLSSFVYNLLYKKWKKENNKKIFKEITQLYSDIKNN
ncbi:MAG: hypothetical protein K2I76_02545 [Malacoplasma sp.]|nr:hypothetical protein [Malacoplasma sp.]MDE5841634.1 hypothetical protein [Malacoplasma sp.]